MNKLKIAVLDFDDVKNPLLNGGQARATFEVFSRLAKKGHQVTVYSSRYPGYEDRVEKGINYQHIGLGSSNIRLNNLVYILCIPSTVLRLKVDVIAECFTAPISTLLSPLFTSTPVVVIPSSFEADRFSKLYKLPLYLIERLGIRFYKYALPYTVVVQSKMKKLNPNIHTKIVPEGVGPEFFKVKKTTPKHILFIGRFDMSQKGMDLLLKSFAKIANQIKFPLVIAGMGPDKEKVEELIKTLKLESKVKLLGPMYGDKKMKLLSEAIAVAQTSRDETFSCFALEVLASSTTLVKFDIPGLSWADKKVVFNCKPFDVNDYSKLLKTAATNVRKSLRMGQQAREFAKKFTWENVANDYEEYFYKVIDLDAEKSKSRNERNNSKLVKKMSLASNI